MKPKTIILAALLGTAAMYSTAQSIVEWGYCGANAGGGRNLTWALYSDSMLIISGSGAMADYNPLSLTTPVYAPWYSYQGQIQTIIIESGIATIGSGAFYACNSLTSFDVNANNPTYASANGVLFNKAKTLLIQYPRNRPDTNRPSYPN